MKAVLELLDKIPYPVLILAALMLLMAPLLPEPHVLEKLRMLKSGTLKRPIDIFDLFFHLFPFFLLLVKIIRDLVRRGSP